MAGHKIKQLSDLRASNHNKTWSSFQILEFAHLITRAKKEILLPHISSTDGRSKFVARKMNFASTTLSSTPIIWTCKMRTCAFETLGDWFEEETFEQFLSTNLFHLSFLSLWNWNLLHILTVTTLFQNLWQWEIHQNLIWALLLTQYNTSLFHVFSGSALHCASQS